MVWKSFRRLAVIGGTMNNPEENVWLPVHDYKMRIMVLQQSNDPKDGSNVPPQLDEKNTSPVNTNAGLQSLTNGVAQPLNK